MTANGAVPGQLLTKARTSLAAPKVLLAGGFFGYAASRAYYAMFCGLGVRAWGQTASLLSNSLAEA